jgi:predicted ATP-dependent endonuclease of OLD family
MLEEPERNLHPAMIRQIGNMMVEQSELRQIIATTHSSELIAAVGRQSVQCVVRDSSGASIIFQPTNHPKFKAFLEGMGLGELASRGLFIGE